jgi:uncharacterized membrane protein
MRQERIFWIAIFIIGFAVRSTELFHPVDTESWREGDMSSIARNYYRNGMVFSHPQIDWQGNGPGYTESEFPIYPYLIALSYKLFGIYEPIGRILSFLFSLFTIIIFFRLSKYLFDTRTALMVSSFFALSPLLMVTSNSIQPESLMFFFYVGAAFAFIHWLDSQSYKYYLYTIIFSALALLCKITAINIGILFLLTIIFKKGWSFLIKPKVILLGILCIIPSILWYSYGHRFYLLYGNSLGLSNEYAWVGWDFFASFFFVRGILDMEIANIWTYSGMLILFLAVISTKLIKNPSIIFPFFWLIAVGVFYIITSRTSSDSWAFYYHIFSVPSASMLLGISVIEIYDKYSPFLKKGQKLSLQKIKFIKGQLVIFLLFLLVSVYLIEDIKYLIQTKHERIKKSEYFACKDRLSEIIPPGSLILVSGGKCRDQDNYPVAYNKSYFFYWLDLKGYNICLENQSVENVLKYKEKGINFYIAETGALNRRKGMEELFRKRFKTVFECNGIILFKL